VDTVLVDVADKIATVTFDRPPVNAVDHESMAEFQRVFESFTENKDVHVAVFTATGDRAFMAGVDLKTMGRGAERPVDTPPSRIVDPGRVARDAMWAITDCAVPVIAAVNGPALGAGLAFAACCDILVASENATFGTTEINVGLLGASTHLSMLVPRHKARELFFTGNTISAADLHALGSVRTVVPRAELLDAAYELARELAAKSPIALRLAKESMNRVEHLPMKDSYRTEQDYTSRLLRFEDSDEARTAFFEKRDPEWKWR
jgi:enoyl-CoA hydratase/carnithine racemase